VETFGYIVFKDYQPGASGRFNAYEIVLNRAYFSGTGASATVASAAPADGSSAVVVDTMPSSTANGNPNSSSSPASSAVVGKEDMVLIKVALCRVFGALFCYG